MLKKTIVSVILVVLSICCTVQKKKVFIIGIDGCRPDALQAASTPNIDKLMDNSTFSLDAINEATTSSGPSWSSMLTGVWQNKHGVDDNSFYGKNFENYPTFFKYLKDHAPEMHTASISQWGPINDHITEPFADSIINVSGESDLISKTVSYLTNEAPDALFIQFDDVDHAGHVYGFNPDASGYIESIEEVDDGVGQMIAAIENRATYSEENWLIIVSTDHGGIGTSHGGNTLEERNIFIICSNDNITKQEVKKDSILSTVLPPENCLEDSVELYFDGSSKVSTELNEAFNFGADKDFTVECRVRTTHPADVAIVTDKDWVTGRNKGFVFSFKYDGLPWKVNIGDGTNRADINGNEIHDNKWHTLSATFDRDGYLTIFEDGAILDSVSIQSIGNIYSGFPISFGADAKNGYTYKGSIAEVRIFNKLVSKEDINNWSCKKIDSTHTDFESLVGYWRLTEGENFEKVEDLSSTKAHGTISRTEWKNATDTSKVWEYDYSNTPRIVDVAATALEYMCVPILPEWELDGKPFGVSCVATGINERQLKAVKVYPNPAKEYLNFESLKCFDKEITLKIYDLSGREIDTEEIHTAIFQYKCKHLQSGMYFYQIYSGIEMLHSGKFVISSD